MRRYLGARHLIDRYAERWDFWVFSWYNEAFLWNENLIDRYADRWDWEGLSWISELPWSEALLDRYADRWNWRGPPCQYELRHLPPRDQ